MSLLHFNFSMNQCVVQVLKLHSTCLLLKPVACILQVTSLLEFSTILVIGFTELYLQLKNMQFISSWNLSPFSF